MARSTRSCHASRAPDARLRAHRESRGSRIGRGPPPWRRTSSCRRAASSRPPACRPSTITTPTLAVTLRRVPSSTPHRAAHPLHDAGGHELGAASVGPRQQDRELVAAEAGHHVGGAQALLSSAPSATISSSPAACPRVSLTCLKWSRSSISTAPEAPYRRQQLEVGRQLVVEATPVGQPGQRVVVGEVGELPLVAPSLGQVADVGQHLAVVPARRAGSTRLLSVRNPAAGLEQHVQRSRRCPPRRPARSGGPTTVRSCCTTDRRPRSAPVRSAASRPKQPRPRVGRGDAAVPSCSEHRRRRVEEQPLRTLLGATQRVLAGPVAAHVAGQDERLVVATGGAAGRPAPRARGRSARC